MKKSVVNQQSIEQATSLRKLGKQYKEIVEVVGNGITIDWCKRNLKSVVEDSPESNAKAEILRLALLPEGTTYSECCGVLLKFGVCKKEINEEDDAEDTMYAVYQRLKYSIKLKNKEAVFRPMWMNPTDSMNCINDMVLFADELFSRFQGYVDDYMDRRFPDNFNDVGIRKSVEHELASLGIPFKTKESILSRCDRNTDLALKLRNRCGVVEPTLLTGLDKYKPNNEDEDLSYLPY